jgi:hypothetical protein
VSTNQVFILRMQFYGIFFLHPYNQSGRWQDVLDQAFIYEESVHFVESYYIRVSQCTVQKTYSTPMCTYFSIQCLNDTVL